VWVGDDPCRVPLVLGAVQFTHCILLESRERRLSTDNPSRETGA
jgi:hypothetical protein